jgi:hypothetical protein
LISTESTLLQLVAWNSSVPANPKSKRILSGELTVLNDKGNLHASVLVKSLTNRPVHGRSAADQGGVPEAECIA